MKALTVWQPWASCICPKDWMKAENVALPKDVENRTWSTNHRGPLLIHAGKMYDMKAHEAKPESRISGLMANEQMQSCILGIVSVVHCGLWFESSWFEHGKWGWLLRCPVAFDTVIPYRGHQGLFDVPDHIVPPEYITAHQEDLRAYDERME